MLGKDESGCADWCIEVSFVVHLNIHGHTGAMTSMGQRSIFSGPWKQELESCSSMESYDVLPQMLWTKKYLEDQGAMVKDTVLYQDNMSSILLEKNKNLLSSKMTNIWTSVYFMSWSMYTTKH